MSSRRILIVGGSTRAAAGSVLRAGFQPVCADLFADHDLRQMAEVISVENYPESLPNDVKSVLSDEWFYCGALENEIAVLQRLEQQSSQHGVLRGCPSNAAIKLRDPFRLQSILQEAGLAVPPISRNNDTLPVDGSWLQKPFAGAGGRGIRRWNQASDQSPASERCYFQKWLAGQPVSTLIEINPSEPQGYRYIGMAEELPRESLSDGPSEFSYRGSLIEHDSSTEAAHLVKQAVFQLMPVLFKHVPEMNGLIGMDWIMSDDRAWLLEINPRYTATIELFEWTRGCSLLNPADHNPLPSVPVVAKRILYAQQELIAPDLTISADCQDPWQIPARADIPVPGSQILQGWPICTVYAAGTSRSAVLQQLEWQTAAVQEIVGLPSVASRYHR